MIMGVGYSLVRETFPPKSRFSVDDIPDLTGKVAIVTGSNTGVGKETAKALLLHNAKVYVAARNRSKAEAAIQDLKDQTGREAELLLLDLSDLSSVKQAAEEFRGKEKELHMLLNNAGVMVPPIAQLTRQGYDLQFGTNVLGHFYLTKLLLPALLDTARSSPEFKPRVLNTSSCTSWLASELNFDSFKDSSARTVMGTHRLYCQSKLGNIIISNEFARRYGDEGLVFVSMNPGNLKSDLLRHVDGFSSKIMEWFILHPVPCGALTQLWAGTTDEGARLNGKYLIPWARLGRPNPAALDQEMANDLWKWLEEQLEIFEHSNEA